VAHLALKLVLDPIFRAQHFRLGDMDRPFRQHGMGVAVRPDRDRWIGGEPAQPLPVQTQLLGKRRAIDAGQRG